VSRKALLFFLALAVAIVGSLFWIFIRKDVSLHHYAKELGNSVNSSDIASDMMSFASKPHRAGSEENHAVGEKILQELRSTGLRVWTTEYSVQLPQPGAGSLVMTQPVQQELSYFEQALRQDRFSAIAPKEQPFFAYIPNSSVEGEVIYANYGDRQDYEYLKQQGISVAGKIALVRAQGSCRGMKQMIAEQERVAGLLLFPDPKDQGFRKPSYPSGPGINDWVAQRGSMLKFFQYPGDPNENRDVKVNTLPTVPALPVTNQVATTILQRLEGTSNHAWKGWLNASYKVGPGPVSVKITYASKTTTKKIRNIFAMLKSSASKDPFILVSCHYDAWVYGASDPASGTTAVLQAAKALSHLEQHKNWKPNRNILFAFWDAEEYGMIGSTRWLRDQFQTARGGIAAVIYVDSVRGPVFNATLIPGLRSFLDEVLREFHDPNTEKPITEIRPEYDMPGFSDDTIPFSALAGVPVAQLNYGMHYTMYHSIYDNLDWMQKFGDPRYSYINTLARILSLYAVNLSNTKLLPFRFSEFSAHYQKYLSKLLLEKIQDPKDAERLREMIKTLQQIGEIGGRMEGVHIKKIPEDQRSKINQILLSAVLCLTDGRDSSAPLAYRNVAVGPSPENECAGLELPGIQRTLDAQHSEDFLLQANRLNDRLRMMKQKLQEAFSMLQRYS
jgi:N-acetylated-alpha-linked acidic dipeptidase